MDGTLAEFLERLDGDEDFAFLQLSARVASLFVGTISVITRVSAFALACAILRATRNSYEKSKKFLVSLLKSTIYVLLIENTCS